MNLFPKHLCLSALGSVCALLSGCAQTTYHASELPGRYAAKPIRDYSRLDLAQLSTPAPDADTILPGDRLKVSLDPGTLEPDSANVWKVSVNDSGEASLPNIGPIRLAGLTRVEAEKAITQTSLQRDVFLTPSVEVSVEDRREEVILVTGAVGNPGAIKIRSEQISLADAIVRAGGLTADASGVISVSATVRKPVSIAGINNAIQPVSSTTPQAMTISLETTPPDDFGQMMVPAGAVITVEQNEPRPVKVTGVIRNQAVEVPSGENVRLLDALALAGGPTYSNWISDTVTVIRTDPETNQIIRIGASIRGARKNARENILLAPHDIVNVEENILTFTLSTVSGFLGAGFNAARIVP